MIIGEGVLGPVFHTITCDGCRAVHSARGRIAEVERSASEAGWTHLLIVDRPGGRRGYPAAYCPDCLPPSPRVDPPPRDGRPSPDPEAQIAALEAEREALYRLAWRWGLDREEGTYHPDNPPPDYGPWAIPIIRRAAGIDPPAPAESPPQSPSEPRGGP